MILTRELLNALEVIQSILLEESPEEHEKNRAIVTLCIQMNIQYDNQMKDILQKIINIINHNFSYVDKITNEKVIEKIKKFIVDMIDRGPCSSCECSHVKGGNACKSGEPLVDGKHISSSEHHQENYLHHLIMTMMHAIAKSIKDHCSPRITELSGIAGFFHDIGKLITEKFHCDERGVYVSNYGHPSVGSILLSLMQEAFHEEGFSQIDFNIFNIVISQHRCYNYGPSVFDDPCSLSVIKLFYDKYGQDLIDVFYYLGWGDTLGRILSHDIDESQVEEKLSHCMNKITTLKPIETKVVLLLCGGPQTGKSTVANIIMKMFFEICAFVSRDNILWSFVTGVEQDASNHHLYHLVYSLYDTVKTLITMKKNSKGGQKSSLEQKKLQIEEIMKKLEENKISISETFQKYDELDIDLMKELNDMFSNNIRDLINNPKYSIIIVESIMNCFPDKPHLPMNMATTCNLIVPVVNFTSVSEKTLARLNLSLEEYIKECFCASPFEIDKTPEPSYVSSKKITEHETIHGVTTPIVFTDDGMQFNTIRGLNLLKTLLSEIAKHAKGNVETGILPGWPVETKTNVIAFLNYCLKHCKENELNFRDFMMATFGIQVNPRESQLLIMKYAINSTLSQQEKQWQHALTPLRGLICHIVNNEIDFTISTFERSPELQVFYGVSTNQLQDNTRVLSQQFIEFKKNLDEGTSPNSLIVEIKHDGQLGKVIVVRGNKIKVFREEIYKISDEGVKKFIGEIFEESLKQSEGKYALVFTSSSSIFPHIDMCKLILEVLITSPRHDGTILVSDLEGMSFEILFEKYFKIIVTEFVTQINKFKAPIQTILFEMILKNNESLLSGRKLTEIACVNESTKLIILATYDVEGNKETCITDTVWLHPTFWKLTYEQLKDFTQKYYKCLLDPTKNIFETFPGTSCGLPLSAEGLIITDKESNMSCKAKLPSYYDAHKKDLPKQLQIPEPLRKYYTCFQTGVSSEDIKLMLKEFGKEIKGIFEKMNEQVPFLFEDLSKINNPILLEILKWLLKEIPDEIYESPENKKNYLKLDFSSVPKEKIQDKIKQILEGKKCPFNKLLIFSEITISILTGFISHDIKHKPTIESDVLLKEFYKILKEKLPKLPDITNKDAIDFVLEFVKAKGVKPWETEKWVCQVEGMDMTSNLLCKKLMQFLK
jgi:hypothetical protein